MINSRYIKDLRADVAANCRIFLNLCRAAGLSPLVTCTVRDQEQQDVYYKAGTGGRIVTFHKTGVGLAFDICKNIKGQEYSDQTFFLKAGEIGERMGFTWGGRWKSVDMPHFQWDAGKTYKDADIISGRWPPTMPVYMEVVSNMSSDEIIEIACTGDKPSAWAEEATEWAKKEGIFNGDGKGNFGWQQPISREAVAHIIYSVLKRQWC